MSTVHSAASFWPISDPLRHKSSPAPPMQTLPTAKPSHWAYCRRCTWVRWPASHSLSFLPLGLWVWKVCSRAEFWSLGAAILSKSSLRWGRATLAFRPGSPLIRRKRVVCSVLGPFRRPIRPSADLLGRGPAQATLSIFWIRRAAHLNFRPFIT